MTLNNKQKNLTGSEIRTCLKDRPLGNKEKFSFRKRSPRLLDGPSFSRLLVEEHVFAKSQLCNRLTLQTAAAVAEKAYWTYHKLQTHKPTENDLCISTLCLGNATISTGSGKRSTPLKSRELQNKV